MVGCLWKRPTAFLLTKVKVFIFWFKPLNFGLKVLTLQCQIIKYRNMDMKEFMLWLLFGDRKRTMLIALAVVCDYLMFNLMF